MKIGDKVKLTEAALSRPVARTWSQYETRPFMVICSIDINGWFAFDNEDVNTVGGHWNANLFELYIPPNQLDEDLFVL